MKINHSIIILIVILTMSCSEKMLQMGRKGDKIEKEVKQLKTLDSKKTYLETIFRDDQLVRDSKKSTELMMKYGTNSEQYMNYVKTQWKQDSINLIKIEKYLDIHGYPNKEMGSIASSTPWTVIHHAKSYEDRVKNFEKIYEAYIKGDINDSAIYFYLSRMYEEKNGSRLEMKRPYKSEDEINQLIRELSLDEKKANVQKRQQNL